MAKKKQKKAPAIARSEIRFKANNSIVFLQESYRLVKTRLLDINDFVEVTPRGKKKILINKTTVSGVYPLI